MDGLHDLGTLCYGWRLEGDVSWESGCRLQPGWWGTWGRAMAEGSEKKPECHRG